MKITILLLIAISVVGCASRPKPIMAADVSDEWFMSNMDSFYSVVVPKREK